MKLNKITAALALTSVLSTAAAAQIIRIVPGLPAGVPVTRLPSPIQGIYSGSGVRLPAPAMTPSINLFPSAAAPAALIPSALPLAAEPAVFAGKIETTLPAVAIKASRENVAHVVPGVRIRFAGSGAAGNDAAKEKLDDTFDGKRAPRRPVVENERRAPVDSGRHISLPEWDLERELGL